MLRKILNLMLLAVLIGCGGRGVMPSADESHGKVHSMTNKIIYVNVHTQTIDAYEGGRLVRSFPVSTGKASTPTDLGTHWISEKRLWDSYPLVDNGKRYKFYSMYFNGGEAFHYAWWHNNFGRRAMSHGCVNMREPDVAWLFQWAPVGTKVIVRNSSAGNAQPSRPAPVPETRTDSRIPRGFCRVDTTWGNTTVFFSPNWSDKSGYTLPNGTILPVLTSQSGFVHVTEVQRFLPGTGLNRAWISRAALVCHL